MQYFRQVPRGPKLRKEGGICVTVKRAQSEAEREVDFVDRKVEATKHRMEWCAAASKYRCRRCGRSSKQLKNARSMRRPEVVGEEFRPQAESMEKNASGRT